MKLLEQLKDNTARIEEIRNAGDAEAIAKIFEANGSAVAATAAVGAFPTLQCRLCVR